MKYNRKNLRLSFPSIVVPGLSLLMLLTSAITFAQEQHPSQIKPSSQSSAETSAPGVLINAEEDYRIGASDVIAIKVEDAERLNDTFRVPASGIIVMSYLKQVNVLNKTTGEVEKIIADGLRGKYLKDPQVHVTVVQVNSRAFFIQGAVNRPGVYQIEGRTTLFKLINLAGGLKENCGSTAYILREIKSGNQEKENDQGKAATEPAKPQTVTANDSASNQDLPANEDYDLFTVNISRFLKGQIPQNAAVLPGDIVTIPVADVFFVAGEVVHGGEFTLKEGTTLRQALSLAQGTTFEAKASETLIVRENTATGKREEIRIDADAVMKAKKSDIAIMPNDIIIVPNSRMKSVGGALLKAFGASAARMPVRY